MTEQREPVPVETSSRAWRSLLARCHKAEGKNRELRARIAELEQGDQQ